MRGNTFLILDNGVNDIDVNSSNQRINNLGLNVVRTISAGEVVELKFKYNNETRIGDIQPRKII